MAGAMELRVRGLGLGLRDELWWSALASAHRRRVAETLRAGRDVATIRCTDGRFHATLAVALETSASHRMKYPFLDSAASICTLLSPRTPN